MSMQTTYRKTVTEPLLMTFKLRDEHNSHSCAWCTFTHSRTHARMREGKVATSKYKDARKTTPLSRGFLRKLTVVHFVYDVFRIYVGSSLLMAHLLNHINPFHIPTRSPFTT